MAAVDCDKYGFFNGIYGIEQSNWANYWRGLVPDGVISGHGNELEVYALTDGMRVHVKTGQAMVDNHRAWVNTEKELTLATADTTYSRIDLVVLRAIYGNSGESKIQLAVKTGTPAATPEAPSLTQVTGETYEIELACVKVGTGVTTIEPNKVEDKRYVYRLSGVSPNSFSGTSVTAQNDVEHRNGTAIASLVVTLPYFPSPIWCSSICFTSGTSFSGVSFKLDTTGSSYTPYVKGDSLNLASRRYNLLVWWDGSHYWCSSQAATI